MLRLTDDVELSAVVTGRRVFEIDSAAVETFVFDGDVVDNQMPRPR